MSGESDVAEVRWHSRRLLEAQCLGLGAARVRTSGYEEELLVGRFHWSRGKKNVYFGFGACPKCRLVVG